MTVAHRLYTSSERCDVATLSSTWQPGVVTPEEDAPRDAGDVLQCSPPVLARDQIIDLLARSWALAVRDLKPLPSERDHNVLVNGDRVLKVSNPAEQLGVLDMENASLAHIAQVATA